MNRISVRTRNRNDMVDITQDVRSAVRSSGVREGICTVFVPHTTAGVTINEHADPDVASDMIHALDTLVPWDDSYAHVEGNSAAHVKCTLTGSSVTVIVEDGEPQLGTWQGIFFCEYDGPRNRQVWISLVESS